MVLVIEPDAHHPRVEENTEDEDYSSFHDRLNLGEYLDRETGLTFGDALRDQLLPFDDFQCFSSRNIFKGLFQPGWPSDLHLVGSKAAAEAKGHGELRLGSVTAPTGHFPPLPDFAGPDAYLSTNSAAIALRSHQFQPKVLVPAVAFIPVKIGRALVGTHQDIEIAILVDVSLSGSAAHHGRVEFFTHVFWSDEGKVSFAAGASIPVKHGLLPVGQVPRAFVGMPVEEIEIEASI